MHLVFRVASVLGSLVCSFVAGFCWFDAYAQSARNRKIAWDGILPGLVATALSLLLTRAAGQLGRTNTLLVLCIAAGLLGALADRQDYQL